MADEPCYFRKCLELVDIGQMKAPVEMWIVILLVLHAAAQSHCQATEATHGQHIVAEMITTWSVASLIIASWTIWTHSQARKSS